MENNTEGLFQRGYEPEVETPLEVEGIYARIQTLSVPEKGYLLHRLIKTLTTDKMAQVLKEISRGIHRVC
ncbi:MAG: hypothetical protein HLUCCA11_20325 [Phormidesmis priestleyi Ana]|uniref:Uncharacterized protein n=1 Tax=Phormidesmis priestleyi Ana TaxID=1666911 RepID=A0A0P7ZS10_9CYAN|nr:MAG: hypothetical protein HLUCCA11_20325 [Phormidesmis priestleyi Ana]